MLLLGCLGLKEYIAEAILICGVSVSPRVVYVSCCCSATRLPGERPSTRLLGGYARRLMGWR